VLGVLTAPFGALAAAVLYFDLRAASGEAASATSGGPTPGAPPNEPPTPGAPPVGGDGSAFKILSAVGRSSPHRDWSLPGPASITSRE
jgi:hypothetical protein